MVKTATREQVIERFGGKRVQFEHWVREVSDKRTKSGVRHIVKTTATCRVVEDVPVVRYRGADYELKASVFSGANERTSIVCLATIV